MLAFGVGKITTMDKIWFRRDLVVFQQDAKRNANVLLGSSEVIKGDALLFHIRISYRIDQYSEVIGCAL